MARPKKDGLDYFPFDIYFFEDEKVEAISGEFGAKGEVVAIRLLCAVYRNGYFAVWTDLLKMKLLKAIPGTSPELLEQIVNRLVRWGFFDKNLFNSVRVLTSEGIQKRYFKVIKRRNIEWEKLPYLLIETQGKEDDSSPDEENVNNNGVNVNNNSVNVNINPERKEKKRKVNNFDVDDIACAHEQNSLFFNEYFSGKTDLKPLLMQLHRENAATSTIEDFKDLAKLVICEWEQNREKLAPDYTSWAKRLIAQIRIKNRILKGNTNATTNPNRQHDADAAQQKRDESYARVMAELLSNPDTGSPELPW